MKTNESATKTSWRAEFGKRIQKWALISTIHGLSNLVRAQTLWRRLFWIVSLLVCLVLCSLLIASMIVDYFQFDVVAKSRTLPLDDDEYFPVVLVCNENPFLSPASQLYLKDYLREEYSLENFTSYGDIIYRLGLENTTRAFEKILYLMNSPERNRSFGYSSEDVFFEILYYGFPVNLSKIERFFDPVYGPCFRFNSGKNERGESIERMKIVSPAVELSMTILVGVSYELTDYIYESPRNGILIEVKGILLLN